MIGDGAEYLCLERKFITIVCIVVGVCVCFVLLPVLDGVGDSAAE